MILAIHGRRLRGVNGGWPKSVALQFAVRSLRKSDANEFEGGIRPIARTDVKNAAPIWKRMWNGPNLDRHIRQPVERVLRKQNVVSVRPRAAVQSDALPVQLVTAAARQRDDLRMRSPHGVEKRRSGGFVEIPFMHHGGQ